MDSEMIEVQMFYHSSEEQLSIFSKIKMVMKVNLLINKKVVITQDNFFLIDWM